jgi:ribosomal protein S18 acetylase RimI-like enzyme
MDFLPLAGSLRLQKYKFPVVESLQLIIENKITMNKYIDLPVEVAKATIHDAPQITRFQLAMALETENIKLDPEITSEGVLAVFRDPSKGTYYKALAGDLLAASMLTTPEWSDWRNRTILWIQSVYVMPEFRCKGLFKALYENLKQEISIDDEIGGIRLYVDRTNHRAQEVYNRMGMNGEHYKVFEWMK